ncbi:MAG: hypothetical protein ACQ9MH_22595 [Nitrospinales bacterium]
MKPLKASWGSKTPKRLFYFFKLPESLTDITTKRRTKCVFLKELASAFQSFAVIALGNFANAITYGINDNGAHPDVVSLSGFRQIAGANGDPVLISSGRCSGSLIRKEDDMLVFLTAGHCSQFWLDGLQNGSLVEVGVSFDEIIDKDLGVTATSDGQYIIGGQPVLYDGYFPGENAWNIQFDYGLVVVPISEGGLKTGNGSPVDLAEIEQVTLIDIPDYLYDFGDKHDPFIFTQVGYGIGEYLNRPGEGNKGGVSPDLDTFLTRSIADNSVFHGFMGSKRNLMRSFQHFAKDQNGSCGGDSGGPNFLEIGGVETQVSVISSGSFPCNSTSITARLDIPVAMVFIDCALTDPFPIDCGCIEINKHGMCP